MSSLAPDQNRKKNALKILNTAGITKAFKSFMNLNIGSYHVQRFRRVKFSHGVKIRVDFYDFFMYLPQRFSRVLDKKLIGELNSTKQLTMTYSGESPQGVLLDFDLVKYDVDFDVF